MNSITKALQAAGVKTPSQYQRIWQWLKDNGMNTVEAVSKALNLPRTSVQSAISDMYYRKMLAKHKRYDARLSPLACNYEALGKEYEMLPRPLEGRKTRVAKVEKAKPVAAPAGDLVREQAAITYATITLRVPRGVAKVYEEHAKEFGVGVDDVLRLALEAYGKKMGLPMMALDPTQALRKKLEGGV